MAAASLHSVRKELSDVTECSICTEVYTDPRSLPCVHTFCLKCLLQWGQEKHPGDDLECPLCRKKFVIPVGGLNDLPKNFFMEKMKFIKDLSASSGANPNYCEECCAEETDPSKKKLATTYCVDCQEKLCQDCDNAHKSLKATRNHKRIDMRDQISSVVNKDHSSFCDEHRDEELKLFCTECKIAICVTCFAASHKSHECLNIDDISDEFRRQMTVDVANAAESIDRLRDVLKHLSKEEQDLDGLVNRLEQEVSSRAEQLKQNVERDKQAIIAEMKSAHQERIKQLHHLRYDVEQHVSILRSLKQYTEELCLNGTACDIGREKTALHRRTDELLKFDDIQRALNDLGSLTVAFTSAAPSSLNDTAANIVGKIDVKKTSTLVATIPVRKQPTVTIESRQSSRDPSSGAAAAASPPSSSAPSVVHIIPSVHEVRGVTSLNDGLFVARDKYVEVYAMANFTEHRQQRIEILGLIGGIRGLAGCNLYCCLYVSDCNGDAVYKVDLSAGNKTTKWRVDGGPLGLSINNVNNLIVTCKGNNKILEFTTGGSLVRKIRLQSDVTCPYHAIQLTSGQYAGHFVICHEGSSHQVCIVDGKGRVKVSYGNAPGSAIGQLNGPYHLAVLHGHIFVADCENNRIVVLSPALNSSRDLPVSVGGGLQYPWRLFMYESHGRLFVGEGSGRVLVLNIAEWI